MNFMFFFVAILVSQPTWEDDPEPIECPMPRERESYDAHCHYEMEGNNCNMHCKWELCPSCGFSEGCHSGTTEVPLQYCYSNVSLITECFWDPFLHRFYCIDNDNHRVYFPRQYSCIVAGACG